MKDGDDCVNDGCDNRGAGDWNGNYRVAFMADGGGGGGGERQHW